MDIKKLTPFFFEDVKVPKENLIGEEGKGWTYAKYLLEFERGNGYSASLYSSLDKVVEMAKTQISSDGALIEDTAYLDKVARVEIQINALEATELRILGSLICRAECGTRIIFIKD